MLNNRLAAARMIAERLTACENAIDDALISAAELTSATPVARRTANISPVAVQDALALSGEAIAALHEARAKMVAAHHAFAEVRDQMGLTPRMTGDGWKINELSGKPATSRLAVVHEKAA